MGAEQPQAPRSQLSGEGSAAAKQLGEGFDAAPRGFPELAKELGIDWGG